MKRSKIGRKNEKGIALIFSLVMVGLLLQLKERTLDHYFIKPMKI